MGACKSITNGRDCIEKSAWNNSNYAAIDQFIL